MTVAVSVNGVEISDRAVDAEVQYHPAASLTEARRAAVQALVIRELLLQEAGRLGVREPDPLEPSGDLRETSEEGLIRTVLARAVRTPDPDEAACRRYYENNRAKFRSPDLFEAAHILFVADPEDEEALARARDACERTLAELTADPNRFAELAKEHSACPSAAQGGNLGQVGRGQTAPEFETFLFALEPGQICPVPVKTRFGFHVLRLDRRIEGRQLPFEHAKDRIAEYLRDRVWHTAVRQYLTLLVGEADIRGIDLAGATSPLVQ